MFIESNHVTTTLSKKLKVVGGTPFLGGYIGCEIDKKKFVEENMSIWTEHVKNVASMAKPHPQSAHAVATKPLKAERNFLQRVIQIEEESFFPIKILLIILSSRPYLALG